MTHINSKIWQANSDGWVATMNKSKENKEEYRKYVEKNRKACALQRVVKRI